MAETQRLLLERSPFLAALDECLAEAAAARKGWFVLLGGEAGVGKTALIRHFLESHRRSTRVLLGSCDALTPPRPLGPFSDIAARTHGEFENLVEHGAKPAVVVGALLRELGVHTPTVAVLEDVHWADEATLDLIRLLGRRMEDTPALMVASFRDDLDREHPLRVVLGELATSPAVRRLQLSPLSRDSVAQLAAQRGVDPDELYRLTAGNPFFVTEVLAAGQKGIAPTVRDAVLGRAARLSPAAQELLESVAVVPPQAELWLLEAIAPDILSRLDQCLASGMLKEERGLVGFRHELARISVESAIPPQKRVALHRAVLEALSAPPGGVRDFARLAHHAEEAGDHQAIVEFAQAAGARAALVSAHREAAEQFGRALRFADALGLKERAELLERRAYECFTTSQHEAALEARRAARDGYHALGDRRKEGDQVRWLSRQNWVLGRNADAEQLAGEAVELLEKLPPSRELARAYSNLAMLRMLAGQREDTLAWGRKALALAERLGDTEVLIQTLNTIGTAECKDGSDVGIPKLVRSLDLALEAGLEEQVVRAFNNLAETASRLHRYAQVDRYLDAGIQYCIEHDRDHDGLWMRANRSTSDLEQGRWAIAADRASEIIRNPIAPPPVQNEALVVLGLVRARMGEPEWRGPLDQALQLARPTGELQQLADVAAARAEAAWLDRDLELAVRETEAALELALRRRDPKLIGQLLCWRRRAGVVEEVSAAVDQPYALELKGDWAAAAELWTTIGCPYEAALALAEGDEAALRKSLSELQRMGARPAARLVARRLRELGARGLKRGPRPATRKNPANLTVSELNVLKLLAQGLRNAEIAERLFLSAKTVDHHVSAILHKLGVATRGQATAEAMRLGLAGEDR